MKEQHIQIRSQKFLNYKFDINKSALTFILFTLFLRGHDSSRKYSFYRRYSRKAGQHLIEAKLLFKLIFLLYCSKIISRQNVSLVPRNVSLVRFGTKIIALQRVQLNIWNLQSHSDQFSALKFGVGNNFSISKNCLLIKKKVLALISIARSLCGPYSLLWDNSTLWSLKVKPNI